MKIIKLAVVLGMIVYPGASYAQEMPYPDRVVDTIYKVEGGSKAKVPYGILSVKCRDKAACREICRRTVVNNLKRWKKAGKPGNFLDYLANRYCPLAADPIGNVRWKHNIHALLDK